MYGRGLSLLEIPSGGRHFRFVNLPSVALCMKGKKSMLLYTRVNYSHIFTLKRTLQINLTQELWMYFVNTPPTRPPLQPNLKLKEKDTE